MLDHADLIIPDVYGPDVLSAVRWLQEHLPFSDQYLAQLIGVSSIDEFFYGRMIVVIPGFIFDVPIL